MRCLLCFDRFCLLLFAVVAGYWRSAGGGVRLKYFVQNVMKVQKIKEYSVLNNYIIYKNVYRC